MSLYQELSHKLHDFLALRIPLIEQASIDEFYGDLSGWVEDEDIPAFIDALRHEIKKELKLPVSIGAAKTRYIAKLATTYAKPFGCKTIYKRDFDKFVNPIAIRSFAGIGKSMYDKLTESNIYTLGELRANRGRVESFGPYAKELYKRVNGESDDSIKTTHQRKSIGISRTFDPLFDRKELQRRVHVLARHLSFAIGKLGVIPTVFHLGIAYEMNQSSHKNVSLAEIFTEKKFDALCMELFHAADTQKRLQVIRLSINCSSFTRDSKKELSLIGFDEEQKSLALSRSLQDLREKYGIDSVKFASEM
jgi:DNA polymerase-4